MNFAKILNDYLDKQKVDIFTNKSKSTIPIPIGYLIIYDLLKKRIITIMVIHFSSLVIWNLHAAIGFLYFLVSLTISLILVHLTH